MSVRVPLRLRPGFSLLFAVAKRTASTSPTDPIQRAFVQKLREYAQKSKTGEMGLANATPSELKELNDTLARVDKIFGASGQDMTQFPSFKFEEPHLLSPQSAINVEPPAATDVTQHEEEKAKDDRYVISI
ncbi:Mitochondrial ATP synthase coupling factor 6 [Fasciola gigantica]|uniref:Mitochondrial ATP synthase coupling factor 6 n=1 Tax=Fasciola gigantica TaxID=46835 RepID=A0A504YDA3_FASGI|nr:Mitochondrial ATP synthase coupling factor 6 [Fasciola gigantica]